MGADGAPVQIREVDGLLSLPDMRSGDLELVQRHGLWPGDDYMNGRTVTLTLGVHGETLEEFTGALGAVQAAFCPGRKEKPLRFRFPGLTADREAFVSVRPRKRSAPLSVSFAARSCEVVVELFATDPLIYGVDRREVEVKSLVRPPLDGGLKLPARMPWHIKGSSAAPPDPVTSFMQCGAVPARPEIHVMNAASPTLFDDATGWRFGVHYDGDFVIDSAAQTVTAIGGADITGLIKEGSVWPEYGFGKHLLRLVSRNQFTAAVAAFSWADRWL